MDTIYPIVSKLNIDMLDEPNLSNILLYGNKKLTLGENRRLLQATIIFILNSKRFMEIDHD